MRPVIAVVAALLIAGAVSAQVRITRPVETQPAEAQPITHGEFAVLLLEVVGTQPVKAREPGAALAEVKRLELVPQTWQVAAFLTYGEFADVLERFGAHYTPVDREALASREFVEAMLRRELLRLRDYTARRMGHGASLTHILDEGVDRGVVSPSDF